MFKIEMIFRAGTARSEVREIAKTLQAIGTIERVRVFSSSETDHITAHVPTGSAALVLLESAERFKFNVNFIFN